MTSALESRRHPELVAAEHGLVAWPQTRSPSIGPCPRRGAGCAAYHRHTWNASTKAAPDSHWNWTLTFAAQHRNLLHHALSILSAAAYCERHR
ncbi:hypothetical protein ABQF35_30640 [Mycobacterium syngnathidarum]